MATLSSIPKLFVHIVVIFDFVAHLNLVCAVVLSLRLIREVENAGAWRSYSKTIVEHWSKLSA